MQKEKEKNQLKEDEILIHLPWQLEKPQSKASP